jgi:hypothetical protein
MSPEEANMIIKARDAWNKDRTPLSDNLEPDITGKINSAFSFSESGAYTITVKASETKNSPARTLIISLKISNTIQEGGLKYYEYLLF